jgi:hypothetical protein
MRFFQSARGTSLVLGFLCILFSLGSTSLRAQTFGCSPAKMNDIVCENSKTGNPPSDWSISDVGDLTIQGFTTDISVNQGGTISFKVKTNASSWHINIFRMGYYAGNGARLIATVTPSVALPQTQPACLTNSTTNLYDCGNWAVSASWQVPANATSGLYFGVLTRDDTGGVSQAFFVVRNDSSHSSVLYQTSDPTWEAYNDYGGHSLYGGAGTFDLPNRAFKVSYNRPFDTRNFESATFLFNAEYPMIRWLEANGFDMTYSTGVDAARNGALIQNHQLYLSSGHDEYWSGPQRTNVEAARDAGVNMAFFSGNEVFWKTRFENSTDGSNTPYRTLVCYKETLSNAVTDPMDPPTWTGTWRDTRFSPPADGGRPENSLTGTIFLVNGPGTDNTGLSIKVPSTYAPLRFWRNTTIANLTAGQTSTLPSGTLGYEWDSDLDNGARPAGLIDMSSATYNLTTDLLLDYGGVYGGGTATHHLTLYKAPSGALVFGAGTVQWAYGLDSNHDSPNSDDLPPSKDMQQATINLFADMGIQPGSLQSGLLLASKSTDTTSPISTISSPTGGTTQELGNTISVSGTASDSGGGVVAGVEVSVDGGQTWHPASGLQTWSYSWTISASGAINIKSRATDDSANIESPSAGITVNVPKPQTSIDVQVNTNGATASTTVKSPNFSTNATNELLLAFVSTDYLGGTNTTVTGVTGAGLTWVLVARANGQSGSSEIWRTFSPGLLSGASVTATLSQNVISSITIATFSGVNTSGTNGSGAIGATKTTSAGSGGPSATLLTTQNNSLIFGVGNDYDNAIARSPAAGQSLLSQYLTPTGDTYWTQFLNLPILQKGTSATLNDTAPTGDRYNLAICEILAGTGAQSFGISGSVTPGASGTGTLLSLSGPVSGTATADASGNFSFSGLPSGSYTILPNKAGQTFTPSSQSVTIAGASVTGVTFSTAALPTHSISGSITPAAVGTGTTLTLTSTGEGGSNATVTADASGNYTFPAVVDGSYKITPTKSGTTFSPVNQAVTLSGSNMTGINFTATGVPTWSITGNISPASLGTGVTVTLGGAAAATTTADASGNFSFANLANGSYTVTPSKTGLTFSPANQGVTISSANAVANFTVPTWTISGSITPAANGTGSTVTLSGTSSATTTADSSGNYSFSGLLNGGYTITPIKSGFSFTPANQAVTVSNANVSAAAFSAQTASTTVIAIDANISKDQSSASTTVASPAFSTTAPNELLLAFVSTDDPGTGTNITVTGVAGGGLTWTLVVRSNAQRGTSEIWRAFAPSTLTGAAVTATLTNSVTSSLAVMSFSGVDATGTNGSGAIGATATGNAATGAPTAKLSTTRGNSLVVGVGNDYDDAKARTIGTGQTLIHQFLSPTGDTYWMQRQTAATPLSSTSVTLNDTAPTADRYNMAICEILVSQ